METDFRVGDYIEGRYHVRRVLGGGMGTVYVAMDIALDQLVAVKTFHSRRADKLGEWFVAESQTWIQLERHPHIVQAKTTFLAAGQPYLVVEYVDGGDLRRRLDGGPLDVVPALELALQFCAGAYYASRKLGLIHRDVKPENLLLTRGGMLKITDFGLSRIEGNALAHRGPMGTPLYMSPEQWIGPEAVTRQSDIYSFGVVLHEMLTGRNSFKAPTLEAIRKAHEHLTPPDVRADRPEVPAGLAAVVRKCLAKNPLRRFFDYDDLEERLQQVYRECTGGRYALPADADRDRLAAPPADLLNSGDALATLGRHREALAYYERLLDLQPRAAVFWQRKGEALARLGKPHEALLYFGKALELEPSNLDAVKGKVRGLMAVGQGEEALACCGPILALNPNDRNLLEYKRHLLGVAVRGPGDDLDPLLRPPPGTTRDLNPAPPSRAGTYPSAPDTPAAEGKDSGSVSVAPEQYDSEFELTLDGDSGAPSDGTKPGEEGDDSEFEDDFEIPHPPPVTPDRTTVGEKDDDREIGHSLDDDSGLPPGGSKPEDPGDRDGGPGVKS